MEDQIVVDLMQKLTDNAIAVTQVTVSLNDTNSRLSEAITQIKEVSQEMRETSRDHETRIVDVEHNCRKTEDWTRAWTRIEKLETAEQKRSGAKPLFDRILDSLQSVLIAVVVVFVLFFMKGGSIS